jgi:hypothetical protein
VSRRVAFLLPLVLLAGCAPSGGGGVDTGSFQGAEKDVAQALDDLTDAARRKDGGRVCSELLAKALVDKLDANGGCSKALDDQLDDVDVAALDVDDVTVSGNCATAKVRAEFNGDKMTSTLKLALEDRRWRLAGLGGC